MMPEHDDLRELNREIAELKGWHHFPPPYSTDWAFAGPLLEEMASGCDLDASRPLYVTLANAGGHHYVNRRGITGDTAHCQECGALTAMINKGNGVAVSPTEAIARAWLAWKKGSD